MKAFEITITCHNQYGIELFNNGNDPDFMKKQSFLKMAVINNHMDLDYYKMKDKVNPFLQGYDVENWIMVEFWTDDFEAIEKYIDFLNEKYYTEWE